MQLGDHEPVPRRPLRGGATPSRLRARASALRPSHPGRGHALHRARDGEAPRRRPCRLPGGCRHRCQSRRSAAALALRARHSQAEQARRASVVRRCTPLDTHDRRQRPARCMCHAPLTRRYSALGRWTEPRSRRRPAPASGEDCWCTGLGADRAFPVDASTHDFVKVRTGSGDQGARV